MGEPRRIMVVDDDRARLGRTVAVLEGAGYEVIPRDLAIGTAGAILRDRPAVVLLEVGTALLDGPEIAAAVRANARLKDTRTVLVGGGPPETLAARARECGADGSVHRPCEPAALLEVVGRWASPRGGRDRDQSGTRLKRPGRVLVAGEPTTHRLVAAELANRRALTLTDSGTEALRRICAPSPPGRVVLGTSLTDLPFDVIWREAVTLDEAWAERIVIVEEREATPGARPPAMRCWHPGEPLEALVASLDRRAG